MWLTVDVTSVEQVSILELERWTKLPKETTVKETKQLTGTNKSTTAYSLWGVVRTAILILVLVLFVVLLVFLELRRQKFRKGCKRYSNTNSKGSQQIPGKNASGSF